MMDSKKIERLLLKLKDVFLDETEENRRMLDVYFKSIEGSVSNEELDFANNQLKQVLKNLGLGILVVLPFSPITIPYLIKKSKEFNIDIVPKWYKIEKMDYLVQIGENGPNWTNWSKLDKMVQIGQNGPNWTKWSKLDKMI